MERTGPTAEEAGLAGLPGTAQASSDEAEGGVGGVNFAKGQGEEGTRTSGAEETLKLRREQLELEALELDLAERREKQAERALRIKERERELAERGKGDLEVTRDATPETMSSVSMSRGDDDTKEISTSVPDSDKQLAGSGPSGELAKMVAVMRQQSTGVQQGFASELGDLEQQTASAADDKRKRLHAARTLAELAVREARTSRVTELANLVAVALSLVKKSTDVLDHLVLLLVVGFGV
jgi:hypothetical protein